MTPYLFADDAKRLVRFISESFGGETVYCKERPDGSVMHAELRIGNSMLMLADATTDFPAMPTSIYLYVSDCDRTHKKALEHDGESIFAVTDMPSGERYGGIKDPCGNIWWIATHVADVPADEQERRWKEFQG